MEYIASIAIAVCNFPFVAVLFTAPYAAKQYRKYGACQIFRTFVVYSFILYCMCAYFLVIFPLPKKEVVAQMTGPTMQLVPFEFIIDFVKKSGIVWSSPSTYIKALKSNTFYQPAFNAVLLLPFGFYLRYYFQRNKKQTILFTFLFSLFFEITQLTALFGMYPRPYRLFDVDDLMLNTLGGFLGYCLVPLFKFLPDRKKIDEMSYQSGTKVSILRRGYAFAFDWFIVEVMSSILFISVNLLHLEKVKATGLFSFLPWYMISVALYFFLLPLLKGGQTFGKKLVRIRIVSDDGTNAKWWQYVVRYGILYYIIGTIPMNLLSGNMLFPEKLRIALLCLRLLICLAIGIRLFISLIKIPLHKEERFLYEKVSKTHNISTIDAEKYLKNKKE